MIRLVYSNRTEDLLAALAAAIAEVRKTTSLFDPITIVVPNRNVEAYLKQGIAEELGIAANLRICFLAPLVRDLMRDAAPGIRVIDRELLEGQVLAVLLDPSAMAHPELESARAWISASGDSPAAIDKRRFQLALQMARLFDEYAGSRPDWLDGWSAKLTFDKGPARELETWQRRLWLLVQARLREREKDEEVSYRLLRDVFRGMSTEKLNVPSSLFVFGFSYFPPAYHAFFETISGASAVSLFTLNPCRQYWEDVHQADDAHEMPLLRQWGRPGRVHVAMLNSLSVQRAYELYATPAGTSLLAAVQSAVLERASNEPSVATRELDDSIALTACPSMRREAEEVAAQIWEALEESASSARPLRFHEIGVFINPSERDAYLSHLTSAFRDNHGIPHHVVDLPLAMESRLVEAVELLLALPNGRFGRAEMLNLLTHPAFASRYPSIDVSRWVELVDELAILHGADHSDHAGTYIERDAFNWDQGLKRIALGAFMNADDDSPPYVQGTQSYAPFALPESLRENAALLASAVRALIADVRRAANAKLTIQEWAEVLGDFVKTHLAAPEEADARDLKICLAAIEDLSDIEMDGTPVSFRIAHDFAIGKLAGIGARRGPFLEGGVVVSSFFPMRAIPFRVVFALGLGEGKFPAPEIVNPLDLRGFAPHPADVTQRAQDKYLFLETLLCARDKLALSYVARNEITGDPLEPSVLVRDLMGYLHTRHGVEDREPTVESLRRFDSRNVDGARLLPDEAHREAFALRLGAEARQAMHGPVSIGQVREALSPESRQRLDAALGMHARDRILTPVKERVRVSISALRLFLECQVQGYAKFHFGDRDDESEDDIATLENEPFELKPYAKVPFLRRAWVDALSLSRTPDSYVEEQARRLVLRGEWPEGVFARAELAHAKDVLRRWSEQLADDASLGSCTFRTHTFGPVDEADQTAIAHPSLALSLPRNADGVVREVELVGRINAMDESTSTYLHLVSTSSMDPNKLSRYRREACLRLTLESSLVAAATGTSTESCAFALAIACDEPTNLIAKSVPGWNSEEARTWLQSLVSDLLGDAPQNLLPYEAAFKWATSTKPMRLSDTIDDMVEAHEAGDESAERYSFAKGPIRRVGELETLDEESLKRLVLRRLEPVLARSLEGKDK